MPIASLDREDKGRKISATSLNTRSSWWQTRPPTELTTPTRMVGAGFLSSTNYSPEWTALRVLGLVRRSNVLVHLDRLIAPVFHRRRPRPGICVRADRSQAGGRKFHKGDL